MFKILYESIPLKRVIQKESIDSIIATTVQIISVPNLWRNTTTNSNLDIFTYIFYKAFICFLFVWKPLILICSCSRIDSSEMMLSKRIDSFNVSQESKHWFCELTFQRKDVKIQIQKLFIKHILSLICENYWLKYVSPSKQLHFLPV